MRNPGFNPKARWDRRMPNCRHAEVKPQRNTTFGIPQSDCSDSNSLNEKIEVLAWFKNAKAYPRRFTWNHKGYKIKNITYNWQERRGSELISYFSVDTGTDLYQISFNNTSFGWRLDKRIE